MENNNSEQHQEEKGNKSSIVKILLASSIILNILLLFLYFSEKKELEKQTEIIKTVFIEKGDVESDLLNLKKSFEDLKTNDSTLKTEIEEKKLQIEQLMEEAKKHKGDARIIAKLKKETETLRAIMKGYVRTIDSLNTLNQKLIVEKGEVIKSLDQEKEKSTKLNKEKEELQSTINKGSILACTNITAQGVNVKSGGKKFSVTNKAKRADMIRVSFSLGENKIARSGSKDIFVRIITPDGKEMAKSYDDNYRFIFNSSSGYYAGKTNINYGNKEVGVTTMCEGNSTLLPGKYQIEVTADGVVIGETSLTLD